MYHVTVSKLALCQLLLIFLCFVPPISYAGLDAPHDASTSTGCLSCHDMTSSEPKHLPAMGHSSEDIDDTVFNNLCWSCHKNPAIPPQYMETHSSKQTSKKYGDWTVECWVCHNQHTQEQAGGKFIRTKINLDWITYKNDADRPATKTGTKIVEFTGPNSFADGNITYDGICEVCHTLTSYHRNTSTGNHTHYTGQDCKTCHTHANGFIHGNNGSGSNDCIICHGHDAGYEYEPGKFSQGAGTYKSHSAHTEKDVDDQNGPFVPCATCHDTSNFPFFLSGNDGNGDGIFNLAETDVCDACHNDGTGISTGSLILKAPPVWNTTSLTCTSCHTIGPAYANGTPKANSHSVHSIFSCSTCHASTTSDGTDINDQSVHPNGSYTLQADAGITFSYTFNAAGSTCTNISCHGNQNATWGTTLSCDSCHAYPPVPGDGKEINEVFDGGKGAHVTSWDTTGPLGRGGHIIYPDGLNPVADVYGDTSTGYNECYKCHKNGTHADGTVDVMISGDPWSTVTGSGIHYDRPSGFGLFGGGQVYLGVPGNISQPKTCDSIVCHQGDTPRWSCPGGE